MRGRGYSHHTTSTSLLQQVCLLVHFSVCSALSPLPLPAAVCVTVVTRKTLIHWTGCPWLLEPGWGQLEVGTQHTCTVFQEMSCYIFSLAVVNSGLATSDLMLSGRGQALMVQTLTPHCSSLRPNDPGQWRTFPAQVKRVCV